MSAWIIFALIVLAAIVLAVIYAAVAGRYENESLDDFDDLFDNDEDYT